MKQISHFHCYEEKTSVTFKRFTVVFEKQSSAKNESMIHPDD